jgi:hypothetical protein
MLLLVDDEYSVIPILFVLLDSDTGMDQPYI